MPTILSRGTTGVSTSSRPPVGNTLITSVAGDNCSSAGTAVASSASTAGIMRTTPAVASSSSMGNSPGGSSPRTPSGPVTSAQTKKPKFSRRVVFITGPEDRECSNRPVIPAMAVVLILRTDRAIELNGNTGMTLRHANSRPSPFIPPIFLPKNRLLCDQPTDGSRPG